MTRRRYSRRPTLTVEDIHLLVAHSLGQEVDPTHLANLEERGHVRSRYLTEKGAKWVGFAHSKAHQAQWVDLDRHGAEVEFRESRLSELPEDLRPTSMGWTQGASTSCRTGRGGMCLLIVEAVGEAALARALTEIRRVLSGGWTITRRGRHVAAVRGEDRVDFWRNAAAAGRPAFDECVAYGPDGEVIRSISKAVEAGAITPELLAMLREVAP